MFLFRIKKIYPLTLIELTVAFSLMGIVLFFLFSTLQNSSALSRKVAEVRPKVLTRDQCFQRLMHISSSIDPETLTFEEEEDNPKKITFSFVNGLDVERAYSGNVTGTLKLEKGALFLEVLPKEPNLPPRQELLLNGIEDFSWETETPSLILLTVTEKDQRTTLFPLFISKIDGFSLQKGEK